MTQEDKELLLKDLCARLPYGVKCRYSHIQDTINGKIIDINIFGRVNIDGGIKDICDIKPYLFPLSSMNLGQRIEYSQTLIIFNETQCSQTSESYDWLNKNHFDYRGLIEKGLANDATGKNIY